MSKDSKKKINLGLIIGPLGVIAGIMLMFGEDGFMGIFGTIASAFVTYLGYKEWKGIA